jgi:hypothetical protein
MGYFKEVVTARADDIVKKWIDFFVLNNKTRADSQEVEMTSTPIVLVSVVQVGDLQLRLSFSDGREQTVDFKRFLSQSQHPDLRAYLDPGRFAAFRIEYGDLVWGDYDLCFPLIDLYRNDLEHRLPQEHVAA